MSFFEQRFEFDNIRQSFLTELALELTAQCPTFLVFHLIINNQWKELKEIIQTYRKSFFYFDIYMLFYWEIFGLFPLGKLTHFFGLDNWVVNRVHISNLYTKIGLYLLLPGLFSWKLKIK